MKMETEARFLRRRARIRIRFEVSTEYEEEGTGRGRLFNTMRTGKNTDYDKWTATYLRGVKLEREGFLEAACLQMLEAVARRVGRIW